MICVASGSAGAGTRSGISDTLCRISCTANFELAKAKRKGTPFRMCPVGMPRQAAYNHLFIRLNLEPHEAEAILKECFPS
jgi:hypothetical protein